MSGEKRKPTGASYAERRSIYAGRVKGVALALMGINAMQAITFAGMEIDREAEQRQAQAVPPKPPAQTEVVEFEEPTDETIVDPDQTDSPVIETSPAPELQETTGLGIEWLPPTVDYWADEIEARCAPYGLDPRDVGKLMTLESGGNPWAESYDENDQVLAIGLMQILPETAASEIYPDLAAMGYNNPNYDLYDPATSILFGCHYLAKLRDQYIAPYLRPEHTETDLATFMAAGYHSGPDKAQDLAAGINTLGRKGRIYTGYFRAMSEQQAAPSSPAFASWYYPELGPGHGRSLVAEAQAYFARAGIEVPPQPPVIPERFELDLAA